MKKRTGIFQLPDGSWGYRARIENQFDIRRIRDRNGLIIKTAAAAEKERNWAIAHELERRRDKKAERYGLKNGTVADVYEKCVAPEDQKKRMVQCVNERVSGRIISARDGDSGT